MNDIEIDQAALEREADAVVSDLPPEFEAPDGADAHAGEGGELSPASFQDPTLEQIAAAAEQWEPGVALIVGEAFDTLAPAWRVTPDEKKRVSHAFAMALAAWVPGDALPPKYLVLLMAAGSLYGVVSSRRNPETGELMPRKITQASTNVSPSDDVTERTAETGARGAGFSTTA